MLSILAILTNRKLMFNAKINYSLKFVIQSRKMLLGYILASADVNSYLLAMT